MKDQKKKLILLPVEVKKHIVNGAYQLFSLEDHSFPDADFLLVTEKDDRFLLSWLGEVVQHVADYKPSQSVKVNPEGPFPETNYRTVVAGLKQSTKNLCKLEQ